MDSKSKQIVTSTVLLLVAVALGACGSGADASSQVNRVVCVDSTLATEPAVRASYLPDLEEVAKEAAEDRSWLYVAACGANATGTVRWPIEEELAPKGEYSGSLAERFTKVEVKKLTPRLKRIVATSSHLGGTPLGQMLAVMARQCDAVGGRCQAYLFTDGEWADGLLRVRDGVTKGEQRRYLKTYVPRLRGLTGALVYFIGVGNGTHLSEEQLHGSQRVATALVRKAGGRVAVWNVRLPLGES